ncbi:MAG: hypothetical protein ACR2IF_09200 [Terriglobales bacterium]
MASLGMTAFKGLLVTAMLAAAVTVAQVREKRFEPLIDNSQASAFRLELPPGGRASVYQNRHEILWIALDEARLMATDPEGHESKLVLHRGDVRFFASFRMSRLRNSSDEVFRGVLVELKQRGRTAPGCECGGAAEQAVCGCPRAPRLPAMWAVAIGSIAAGGTTLAPGQRFEAASERGNTLLVAITPVELADDTTSGKIMLRAGEARWIASGIHRWKNLGRRAAQYVTVEF